jgi:hypothetical protein
VEKKFRSHKIGEDVDEATWVLTGLANFKCFLGASLLTRVKNKSKFYTRV